MAQCEKILEDGIRCSNQAVPGTRFCEPHGRIVFRQVNKPADTAPPQPVVQAPAPVSRQKTPSWQAAPSSSGETPAFPALRSDARNILVAPEGVIWLQAEQAGTPSSQWNRLVRLMGCLSQALALPKQVRLFRQGEMGDCLLFLSPIQSGGEDLSVFYDTASAAARLVEGRLYIGQGSAFVQYRDDSAPRGYDVADFKAPGGKGKLLLIAHWGSRVLSLSSFTEMPLMDFCLRVAPSPETGAQTPEQVYALTPSALYLPVAKYLRSHALQYRLAPLQMVAGKLMLLEVSPRPDARAGQGIPAFVLDYLSRLPRVALLTSVYQANGQRVLLQWKHRYPLHIPHIAEAFAAKDMILLLADFYPHMQINPAPQFFDGDQLVDVHFPSTQTLKLTPQAPNDTRALKLEVLLLSDAGPTPPVAALILSLQELAWLSQLLYRLPGDSFSRYTLCQGEEGAVLLGINHPIEGLPFGIPLQRQGETELFIPLRSRFVPNLPWSLLREALAIKRKVYTFLTPEYRLDLPESAFTPLSRALVADPSRPQMKFNLRPATPLPQLRWTAPPEPRREVRPSPQTSDRSALAGLLRVRPGKQAAESKPGQKGQLDEAAHWREQARIYEEVQDFLSAALCYNLLHDVANTARCYRQAADELRAKIYQ
ncbi:MAG TPA: hypothetical protein VKT82_34205 [Ktedonobacterales bacterium]|nr:hypothetical protein [Ktedonobacterales bacterium]